MANVEPSSRWNAPGRCLALAALVAMAATGPLEAAERHAPEPVPIPASRFNAATVGDAGAGWFTRPATDYDLAALPSGAVEMAGVPFIVRDPDDGPNAIMLSGAGSPAETRAVRGIPVGRSCEVLYFLHAFNPGPALADWQQRNRTGKARGDPPLEPPVYSKGLTIEFVAEKDNPIVNAIEVVQVAH